jgi:hypothetical protein
MKTVVIVTLGICTLAATTFAQMPRRQPGPEQERLAYFAGQWKHEGESEGFKYARTETCEWFDGRFHLVCRAEGTGDFGPLKDQSVFTYDRGAKAYTFQIISSLGNTLFARGTIAGSVWTWNSELVGENGPFPARMTVTEQSPTAYTLKLEGLLDGAWIVLEESRATKVP